MLSSSNLGLDEGGASGCLSCSTDRVIVGFSALSGVETGAAASTALSCTADGAGDSRT